MIATSVRPVAIKIDDDTKARLKRLAEVRQRTSHWLMREAITYRTTGLHVTAEEADAWLAKLEQGNDVDPPECHV
jgi:predicted transcriptional regulator